MEFAADIKNLMMPEIILFVGALLLCFIGILTDKAYKRVFSIVVLMLGLSFLMCLQLDTDTVSMAFGGSFLISKFTVFFKELILAGTISTIFLSDKYIKQNQKSVAEFYMLLFVAALGGMILVSSRDFITMFVALETLSISSYILSGFIKEKNSQEATLKYLVTGCVASAVILYGVSLLYGMSGSLRFDVIFAAIKSASMFNIAALSGTLVISGLCFKLATIPFYNWAPDVYEKSPLAVSAFLSTVSKVAGFGIIIRLVSELFNGIWILYLVLGLIALVSMAIGNLLGLCEENVKRLMAYSSIAHAGYILAVLALGSTLSLSSAVFYIITYLLMNFAAWSCLEVLDNGDGVTTESLKGLAYKRPVLAFCMVSAFASLAGLPIFVGFFSKFYLFQAIVFAGFLLYPFLCFVLLNSLIALYYYFKVIRAMFDEQESEQTVFWSKRLAVVLVFSTVMVLLTGIFSSPVITYSQQIAQSQMPAVIQYEAIKGTYFDNPRPISVR
ncbi:MAG: NADH-quinone oxidoreductase subunit N [Candidatus Gastranaerophilales bacterium]|nr:NADH-quinone oxidoreductase subunit N [Candidatus Gastranaerophilales bacterium]